MLVKCEIMGEPCDHNDFVSFHQTQGDCCYTINGIYSNVLSKVEKTKRHKSLVLEFNIEQYEYYDVETAGKLVTVISSPW